MKKIKSIEGHIIICVDCLKGLKKLSDEIIDVCVTSPPYNIGVQYGTHIDRMDKLEYNEFLLNIFLELKRKMKEGGSLFFQVGSNLVNPWISFDISNILREVFILQNHIIWVKSLSINKKTYGHFKPINSKRFLNHNFEHIFHFTKEGNVPIRRTAKNVGVPYKDKSNIKRWKQKKNIRCAGNVWYIPYDTVTSKLQKGNHPAIFPVELPKRCIRLHGYDEKTVVCDPFLGTGTTLVASKILGTNGIGFEIDKEYVKFAKARIRDCIQEVPE